jgi:hypothetical protein
MNKPLLRTTLLVRSCAQNISADKEGKTRLSFEISCQKKNKKIISFWYKYTLLKIKSSLPVSAFPILEKHSSQAERQALWVIECFDSFLVPRRRWMAYALAGSSSLSLSLSFSLSLSLSLSSSFLFWVFSR